MFDDISRNLLIFQKDAKSGLKLNTQLFTVASPSILPNSSTVSMIFNDINNDQKNDLLIYVLVDLNGTGKFFGNVPQLFLRNGSGYTQSDFINKTYSTIKNETNLGIRDWGQVDDTVSAKSITAGDINNDGRTDLWIESSGGHNVAGHFLTNNGESLELSATGYGNDRIDRDSYWGPKHIGWRYNATTLADVNNDTYDDLVLGQMRAHSHQIDARSKVLLNDGMGYFAANNVISLPLPSFNEGWAKACDQAVADLNNDGLVDIATVFTRYGSTTQEFIDTSWTGTYVQLLFQVAPGIYDDKSWLLGDQSPWSATTNKKNDTPSSITVFDGNNDGLKDIFITYSWYLTPNNISRPLGFLANKAGSYDVIDAASVFGKNIGNVRSVKIDDIDQNSVADFIYTNGKTLSIVENPANISILKQGTMRDDTFIGRPGDDSYSGGNGIDVLDYRYAQNGITIDLFSGKAKSLLATDLANIGSDQVTGVENAIGSGFADIITGNKEANSIIGGDGSDTINGGLGKDTLAGGLGADVFVFNTKPAGNNIDTLGDFQLGVDKIQLSLKTFAKLKGASDYLVTGAPTKTTQYLIYDSASGKLSYDAD